MEGQRVVAQWLYVEGRRVSLEEVSGGPARPYVVDRRLVTEWLQVESRYILPGRTFGEGRRVVAKWPYVEGWRIVAERAAGVGTSAAGGAAAGAASLHRTHF